MTYYYERRRAAQISLHLAGPPILLYDADCRLCNGFVDFILAHEREQRIRFCAVQSTAGQAFLSHLGLCVRDWGSNVFIEHGEARFKSEAMLRIARHLRAPWTLLRAMQYAPPSARDWCYDRVATNRYRLFGSSTHCRVVDAAIRDRFIETLADLPVVNSEPVAHLTPSLRQTGRPIE